MFSTKKENLITASAGRFITGTVLLKPKLAEILSAVKSRLNSFYIVLNRF